jgi:GDP-4-dehydro-6-deoxy-D-mannose reductase
MRVLVTGAGGFVGRHMCRLLEEAGDVVFPLSRSTPGPPLVNAHLVDIRDGKALSEAVMATQPDAIVHLAAASSVAHSHNEAVGTFEVNVTGAVNLLVAARGVPGVRVLLVSSGEVYGAVPAGGAATEATPYAPMSPYASAKAAAEIIGFQYARSYGLHVVCARPFNHLGAGQSPAFALPSFARQLAGAPHGAGRVQLFVGNLDPVRDFSHVHDVVAAYRLLLERGVSGEAYNVCSGIGRSVHSALDELTAIAGVEVDAKIDPFKLRPVDIPRMVGSPAKLRALGWAPRLTIQDALRDVLEEARAAIAHLANRAPTPSGRASM